MKFKVAERYELDASYEAEIKPTVALDSDTAVLEIDTLSATDGTQHANIRWIGGHEWLDVSGIELQGNTVTVNGWTRGEARTAVRWRLSSPTRTGTVA